MRIKLSEVTFKRIFEALQRRVLGLKEYYDWRFTDEGNFNRNELLKYKNIHEGKRCFIIANGPSLADTDLSFLQNEITFCMNRIYLLFDKLNFIPTYYVVSNELILEQFAEDILKIPTQKFLNWNRRSFYKSDEKSNFLRFHYAINEKMSTDILSGVYSGGTVTHACFQLAYYMGFQEVIVVGMDHNFVDTGVPSKTEVRSDEVDKNHFHPNYFPKGSKWQLPDLNRCEYVYRDTKEKFEAENRKVLDATIGGKCTIFPKIDYFTIFENEEL
jgi:hypothetical protein